MYTGVGSRKTPTNVLDLMIDIAYYLRICLKLTLRSGGAIGADRAFEKGAGNLKEIYTIKEATEEGRRIASMFHPAWNKCSEFAKDLHGRNSFQVLGKDLKTPSKFLICWTPDGCISHSTRTYITGGTGTAISIADAYNIPIHNLKNEETFNMWTKYVKESKEWVALN